MQMYDYNLSRLVQIAIRAGFPLLQLEHHAMGAVHGVRIFGKRPEQSANPACG